MKDDKLPKLRADTKKQEGSRKRGRPQLRVRWEDCVKRDLRKAEEEEKWREKANNRDRCKQITKVAVPIIYPYTRETRGRTSCQTNNHKLFLTWQSPRCRCVPRDVVMRRAGDAVR